MRTEPLVIVGGGPAGALAAAALARSGRAPLLLERTSGPHAKVCGEFLSWEAVALLERVGFDTAALEGTRIERVRWIEGVREAEAPLPRPGLGVSRFRMDEALLRFAASCGARVERGVAVRSVRDGAEGPLLEVEGDEIAAMRLLLATGKSDLRGAPRRPRKGRFVDDLVGFKLHHRLRPEASRNLRGAVELHGLGRGYAGLLEVEDGIVNLCLVLPASEVREAGGSWSSLRERILDRAPRLADRLSGAEPLGARPLAVSGVPYGFVHRDEGGDPEGLLRIGDQFAVIDSFAGDGMAIAAVSGLASADAAGDPAAGLHARMRREVGPAVRAAARLHGALRVPGVRGAALALAGRFPSLLGRIARRTRVRIPEAKG